MRTAGLFSLVAATFLVGNPVEAQSPAPAARPASAAAPAAPPALAAAQVNNLVVTQEMAARPDAARYYWQHGQWWYYTPQNTWLRWNGAVWVQHVSINYTPPQPTQVRSYRANDYEPLSPPSFRYSINSRRGGL